jgi:hypothetical protein
MYGLGGVAGGVVGGLAGAGVHSRLDTEREKAFSKKDSVRECKFFFPYILDLKLCINNHAPSTACVYLST